MTKVLVLMFVYVTMTSAMTLEQITTKVPAEATVINEVTELPTEVSEPIKALEPTNEPESCEDLGWYVGRLEDGGHYCYKMFYEKKQWSEAIKVCTEHGANLVSIHSEDENSEITETWKLGRASFWIGLKKTGVQDEYEWSDGTAVNYPSVARGQNDIADGKECFIWKVFENSYMASMKWYAKDCAKEFNFICKKAFTETDED